MPNDLITFEFVTQSIRILMVDGEPWFVAADVLEVLTLDRKALERLDSDEKGVSSIHTPGGPQKMSIINESGLYALILTSRKPEAKKFKKWVTSEVLPALRKRGHYTMLGVDEPVFKLTQQDLTDLRCVERGVNAALRARKTIIEPTIKPRPVRENFSEWEKAEMPALGRARSGRGGNCRSAVSPRQLGEKLFVAEPASEARVQLNRSSVEKRKP